MAIRLLECTQNCFVDVAAQPSALIIYALKNSNEETHRHFVIYLQLKTIVRDIKGITLKKPQRSAKPRAQQEVGGYPKRRWSFQVKGETIDGPPSLEASGESDSTLSRNQEF